MPTNKQRGDYYRVKTRKYYEQQGYTVETIEKLQRCFINGRVIFLKKDCLGADLLAMKPSTNEILFVQVKSASESLNGAVNKAKAEFDKYPFPRSATKVIVGWDLKDKRGVMHTWVYNQDEQWYNIDK